MTWDTTLLLAFLTWPPCLTICFIAICRLNAMQEGVLWRVGVEYALWIGVAFGVPLAPLIGEWPGKVTVGVCYALALILFCSAKAWTGDRAPEEATDNAPLESGPTGWRAQAQIFWLLALLRIEALAESARALFTKQR